MSGTTSRCGPECDELLARPNGESRHVFVLEYASDLDLERAYGAAGYQSETRQARHRLLTDDYVQAALRAHRRPVEEAVVEWGDRLREIERWAASAKPTDYASWGNPDPEGWQAVLKLLFEGVEDRTADVAVSREVWRGVEVTYGPGARPPTFAELSKACERMFPLVLRPSDELSEAERHGIIEVKKDRHGNVSLKLDPNARARSAKLEGLIVERHAVTFEQRQADAAAIERDWIAALEAEAEDLTALATEAGLVVPPSASEGLADAQEVSGAIQELLAALEGLAGRVCGRVCG